MPAILTPEQQRSNFCSLPSSELMISPNGDYRVCSLINDHGEDQALCKDVNGVPMNVLTHTFEEAMNSQCHLKIRALHEVNGKPTMCSCCYDRDALPGAGSMRTYKTFEVTRIVPEFTQKFESVTLKKGPVGLDLRFGNLCNLKCITCGPWYSDKWNDDYAAYHNRNFVTFAGKNISILPEAPRVGEIDGVAWWESDIWWERFTDIKPRLRHLYFTGGEPLIVPAHDRVLSELVDGGFAPNVAIELDTNLTALNPRIIGQWRHFKHIDLRVSVDATHDQFTVARFPAKFSRIENNLKTLMADMPPNIRMLVSACVTPLTMFYMKEMDDWAREIFQIPDATDQELNNKIHRRFVEEPYPLSIKSCDKPTKDKMLEWLEKNPSVYSPMVITYIKNNYEDFNPKSQTLVKYMDFLDQRRGTNWRAAFSKAVDVLGL